MATLSLCIRFDGDCEEAFNHYAKVFKSEISSMNKYGDSIFGEGEDAPSLSEEDLKKIQHICLPIGPHSVLMGADDIEITEEKPPHYETFSIYVSEENEAEAYRIFEGLADGGVIQLPMDAYSRDHFGICIDKFGVSWFVNYSSSPDE